MFIYFHYRESFVNLVLLMQVLGYDFFYYTFMNAFKLNFDLETSKEVNSYSCIHKN